MPLTRRINGNDPQNLVKASWFNDFLDLLTGLMSDQVVKIKHNLNLTPISTTLPAAPVLTLITASTGLNQGTYQYGVSFVSGDGGEIIGNFSTVNTTSTQKQVALSAIPIGPAGTVQRKIYRTPVGGNGTNMGLVTTLNDNTTTTYTDALPDTSLGALIPTHSSFGGSLMLPGANGAVMFNGTSSQGEAPNTLWMGAVAGGTGPDLYITNQSSGIIVMRAAGERINLRNGNNTQFGEFTRSSSVFVIKNTGTGGIGLRNNGGRLAEARANGNFTIGGLTYDNNGTGFDGFDVAECYRVDQEYEPGTIVCPVDAAYNYPLDSSDPESTPAVQRCTHDACNMAMTISNIPGFCMGARNVPSMGKITTLTNPSRKQRL
ncbi:hypothetical protein [Ktedonospora formicarum]|uniref:Uncharacterized protein n=1 Tax=Ktedonospora formicarum TaxID=2778364 RepID=A0A8J3I2Y4_9CHLR|nr:hypothetical protein [Ktedonospora formicarum]GHO44509.1 hypothetical protein KSX_26720 [Ktedonospora formicarum]